MDKSPVRWICHNIDSAIDEMNTIRKMAEELRGWGNQMWYNRQETKDELNEQINYCSELEEQIEKLETLLEKEDK